MDIAQRGLSELRRDLDLVKISSVELTEEFIARIHKYNKRYNCFISVRAEEARADAQKADELRAKGGELPALCGIPIAHKDLFCMRGVRTTCASRMLENYVAPYDATVVERLRARGAVVLGKTNMDEFAMGSSNENSAFGAVPNPWDAERVAGGSSGGSASALAAGFCAAATATDTGGSARQPASLCGVTALKPSYGRVSRYGMIAFASSLDHASVLTRNAEDAAWMLGAVAGHDARDSTSVDAPVDDYLSALDETPKLCLGVVDDWLDTNRAGAQAVEQALAVFERLGHTVRRVRLPRMGLGISAYYVLASAECASNLARYDGVRYGYRCENPKSVEDMIVRSRSESLGSEVQRRILIGTFVLSAGYYDAYYVRAQRLRRLICEEFKRAFEEVDILIGSTTMGTAFKLGEKTGSPVEMYREDLYTIPANLAGLPAMSVPVGASENLPLGMHLVAPYLAEATLLSLAHQFQKNSDWHTRVPVLA